MDQLGINLGYLIVQILSFATIFVILRAWMFKPVLELLEKRKLAIARGLEDARIAGEARANAEKDANRIITEAQATASQKVREATERAEQAAKEIRAQAEESIIQARENALTEAGQERDRILADLRHQVAALAMAAAHKLVGETIDESRQRKLIQEFFSGVKDGRVVVLEESGISGTTAEVTSALPLTDEEQDLVRSEILSKTGAQATLAFRVDPSILGGLVVKVGDKVIDGSVSGQLNSMRQSLT